MLENGNALPLRKRGRRTVGRYPGRVLAGENKPVDIVADKSVNRDGRRSGIGQVGDFYILRGQVRPMRAPLGPLVHPTFKQVDFFGAQREFFEWHAQLRVVFG